MTDTTDLIQRLRALGYLQHDDLSIGFEAADDLEQQAAEIAKLKEHSLAAMHDADACLNSAAEIEALRADAERYRALRDVPATFAPSPLREWLWMRPFGTGPKLDAAIDAALRQEKQT